MSDTIYRHMIGVSNRISISGINHVISGDGQRLCVFKGNDYYLFVYKEVSNTPWEKYGWTRDLNDAWKYLTTGEGIEVLT